MQSQPSISSSPRSDSDSWVKEAHLSHFQVLRALRSSKKCHEWEKRGLKAAQSLGGRVKLSQVIPNTNERKLEEEGGPTLMGGDETEENFLYPKLSSRLPPWWVQVRKKSKLCAYPQITNNIFYISWGYSHHIIFNKKICMLNLCQIESSEIKEKNFNLIDAF